MIQFERVPQGKKKEETQINVEEKEREGEPAITDMKSGSYS